MDEVDRDTLGRILFRCRYLEQGYFMVPWDDLPEHERVVWRNTVEAFVRSEELDQWLEQVRRRIAA